MYNTHSMGPLFPEKRGKVIVTVVAVITAFSTFTAGTSTGATNSIWVEVGHNRIMHYYVTMLELHTK